MPFFSTIIPCYNRAGLIRQTLDSVFAQEFTDQEVVVVDDGSTDDTLAVLATYGERIKVLRQTNQGPGSARNRGIREAVGEYVVFLDSDDLWFPWTLSTLHDVLITNALPKIVAGSVIEFTNDQPPLPNSRSRLTLCAYRDYLDASAKGVWVGVGTIAIDRQSLMAARGFVEDRDNAEDTDLWLRLGTIPNFIHIKAPSLCAYRRLPTSTVNDLTKTYNGLCRLLQHEHSGVYPGGAARKSERFQVITRHIRPWSLALLRTGRFNEAWDLYRLSFRLNLQICRARYLLGFPLIMLGRALQSKFADNAPSTIN